jgi:hypothetical protein
LRVARIGSVDDVVVEKVVDIFQMVSTKLFAGLDLVVCFYLDDMVVIPSNFSLEDHMYKAGLAMEHLQMADFQVNACKSVFIVQEIENLAYWLTG